MATVCVENHHESSLEEAMRTAIENLDSVVGEALGLTNKDVSCLQEDLATDAFLRGIRPQYPGTVTRKMGFREGLDATDRYDA